MQPSNAPSAAALAEMLIDADRVAEAIELLRPLRELHDPVLETRLAEALFVTGEAAEALAILDEVCDHYDVQTKELAGADWEALKKRAGEASRLRDDVYAEMHGREATIELAARAGNLDAGAGVNYKLLGARLAATGERIADVLGSRRPRRPSGAGARYSTRSRQRARPRARRLRELRSGRSRPRARRSSARARPTGDVSPRSSGWAPRWTTRRSRCIAARRDSRCRRRAGRARGGRTRLAGADRRRTPRGVAVGAAVRAPARRPRRARRRDPDPADRRARDRHRTVRGRRASTPTITAATTRAPASRPMAARSRRSRSCSTSASTA